MKQRFFIAGVAVVVAIGHGLWTPRFSDAEEGHEHTGAEDHGDHDEEESRNVGPDKGILAVSKGKGFQLSPEAKATFDIKTTKIVGQSFSLPEDAIVFSKGQALLYLERDGFFKPLEVKVVGRNGKLLRLTAIAGSVASNVVTQGASFLRIAQLDAEGGISHSH